MDKEDVIHTDRQTDTHTHTHTHWNTTQLYMSMVLGWIEDYKEV